MKQYILTIIGAAILSALAEIISPEKWRGYIRIITGLVIISCIISPAVSITKSDMFRGFDESFENIGGGENLQSQLVFDELKARIDADIEARMMKEYSLSVTADCVLKVNGDGVFEGVGEIYISGDTLTDSAKDRLCEVYGIELQGVHDE